MIIYICLMVIRVATTWTSRGKHKNHKFKGVLSKHGKGRRDMMPHMVITGDSHLTDESTHVLTLFEIESLLLLEEWELWNKVYLADIYKISNNRFRCMQLDNIFW